MKHRTITPEEHPKGSGFFRARVRIDGKLKTITEPRSSLPEALESIRAFEEMRSASEVRQGVTLSSFGKGALDRRENRGIGGIRQERSRWSLMVDRDPIGALAIKTLERSDLLDWLDRWAKKDVQTRRNALNLLRKVLDEALDRGLCKRNVAREVKVEKAGRARDFDEFGGVLFPNEQAALFEAIPVNHRDRDSVLFGLYGGLRQGSHWALRVEDCGDPKRIRLSTHKSRRPRWLRPLTPAREALERSLKRARKIGSDFAFPAPRGERQRKIPKEWRAWLRAAGINRRVRWHDLRHTCATSLLAGWWGGRKWSLDEVCSYLHHSSTKVTERYARFLEETLLAAIDETKFPERSPVVTTDEAQVLDIVGRRGSDSNRRVTVLQRAEAPSEIATFDGPTFPPGNERGIGAWALALAAERAIFRHARIVSGTVRDRKVREDVGA